MFRSLTCAPTSVCSMSSSTSSTILPCPPPSSSFFHSGALSPRLRLLPALQLLVLGSLVSLTGPPNTTYNPRQRISRPRQQPPVAQPITSWLTAFFFCGHGTKTLANTGSRHDPSSSSGSRQGLKLLLRPPATGTASSDASRSTPLTADPSVRKLTLSQVPNQAS